MRRSDRPAPLLRRVDGKPYATDEHHEDNRPTASGTLSTRTNKDDESDINREPDSSSDSGRDDDKENNPLKRPYSKNSLRPGGYGPRPPAHALTARPPPNARGKASATTTENDGEIFSGSQGSQKASKKSLKTFTKKLKKPRTSSPDEKTENTTVSKRWYPEPLETSHSQH